MGRWGGESIQGVLRDKDGAVRWESTWVLGKDED